MARSDVTPTCRSSLEHTTAGEPGLTLETLNISAGYWRATAESEDILACHNPDACRGGLTGADNFCASGYKGPCKRVLDGELSFRHTSIDLIHPPYYMMIPNPPFAHVVVFFFGVFPYPVRLRRV